MQRYTEIPSSTTLAVSLPMILNNDKTAMSCHAGTTFPTVNLWEGMLCYRTDLEKLYQLKDATTNDWKIIADLSGDARLLEGGKGNAITYDKRNLNSWDDMPTGFYQGSNMLNAPLGDTSWRVIQIRQGNSDGYASQIAFGVSTGKVCTRFQSGGAWSEWMDIQQGKDGKVISGLNADKVDDKEPGNASGNIAVNNGTKNVNLNADKLDGYDAGNASGQIPINNGVVNSGLNADSLDGYHAGNETGQIPVSNRKLNKGLNAEMINGVTVDQFMRLDSNNNPDKALNTLNVTNLNFTNTNAHWVGGTSIAGRSASGTSTGGYDWSTTTFASGSTDPRRYDYKSTTYEFYTNGYIGSGNYNVMDIINKLAACAHYHTVQQKIHYYNCDCVCDCDCSDDNCN